MGKPLFYILKPDNGSKGQGICLAEFSKVLQRWSQMSLIKDDDVSHHVVMRAMCLCVGVAVASVALTR